MTPFELLALGAIGLAVGAFSAFLGVGGGTIMVPVLAIAFGLDQHMAEGTSLAVIVPTAVVGALAHHRRGYLDLRRAAILGAGGVIGVVFGAQLALALSGELLRDVFGLFLIAAGIRQGLSARRPAAGD